MPKFKRPNTYSFSDVEVCVGLGEYDAIVTADFNTTPGHPGRMYMPNGDPGFPPEPGELETGDVLVRKDDGNDHRKPFDIYKAREKHPALMERVCNDEQMRKFESDLEQTLWDKADEKESDDYAAYEAAMDDEMDRRREDALMGD